MSVEKPAAFTMMTWTPDSTHDWRDMSVIIGQDFETNSFFDRDSIETWRDLSVIIGLDFDRRAVHHGEPIHAWRDMSVEKPPAFRATHDDDLDT